MVFGTCEDAIVLRERWFVRRERRDAGSVNWVNWLTLGSLVKMERVRRDV